jgi:phosphoglycolate phosphatase
MTGDSAGRDMACPVCGSRSFVDYSTAKNAKCAKCGSLARHRAAFLLLREHVRPQPHWRVLHIAPETPLAHAFMSACGPGYDPIDIDPDFYAPKIGCAVRRVNLVTDAADLPSEHYDIVAHSHVVEHIPANATLLLQNLQRAIKPGGYHLFAFPIWPGYSSENLDPNMTAEERKRLFKHEQHYRRFGLDDFDVTIGPVVGVTSQYSLTDLLAPEMLRGANIPEKVWRCSGSSVFLVRKPVRT